MNTKIEKLEREIEKAEAKIADLKQKVSDLKAHKTELENVEYVSACREANLSPAELIEFLKSKRLTGQKGEDNES